MPDSTDATSATMLYKILTPEQWSSLPAAGTGAGAGAGAGEEQAWSGAGIDLTDGFIHLSTARQLAGTLALFFASPASAHAHASPKPLATCASDQLVILGAPTASLQDKLKWENGFPHYYGAVRDPRAVFSARYDVRRRAESGEFELPEMQF